MKVSIHDGDCVIQLVCFDGGLRVSLDTSVGRVQSGLQEAGAPPPLSERVTLGRGCGSLHAGHLPCGSAHGHLRGAVGPLRTQAR
eukprot:4843570-Pyramimonas_sp.AAC.2